MAITPYTLLHTNNNILILILYNIQLHLNNNSNIIVKIVLLIIRTNYYDKR
jgi:hypothetical protein